MFLSEWCKEMIWVKSHHMKEMWFNDRNHVLVRRGMFAFLFIRWDMCQCCMSDVGMTFLNKNLRYMHVWIIICLHFGLFVTPVFSCFTRATVHISKCNMQWMLLEEYDQNCAVFLSLCSEYEIDFIPWQGIVSCVDLLLYDICVLTVGSFCGYPLFYILVSNGNSLHQAHIPYLSSSR